MMISDWNILVTNCRKSQLQKVVRHVPVSEGLTSDLWAWRKYGQKPIKGSPYPRYVVVAIITNAS
jgi:WRKY DNA -binding domain